MENRRNFVGYLCGLFSTVFIPKTGYCNDNVQKFKLGDKVRVKSIENISGTIQMCRIKDVDEYTTNQYITLVKERLINQNGSHNQSNIIYRIKLDPSSQINMKERSKNTDAFLLAFRILMGVFSAIEVNQDNLERA